MRRKKFYESGIPLGPLEKTVTVREWNFCDVHSDAGRTGIRWWCPDCHQEVTYATGAWWRFECACRVWDVAITITGTEKSVYWQLDDSN